MGKRKNRKHSPEFRAEAVKLVLDEKRSVNSVAIDLGISGSSLHGWVEQARADAGTGPKGALTTAERQEFAQLRRQVKQLEMEREILKNHPRAGSAPTCGTRNSPCYNGPDPEGAAVRFLETMAIP